MEDILVAWDDYARKCWPGSPPDLKTLRDHAQAMLVALVEDMQVPQSENTRKSKAEGAQNDRKTEINKAALEHAKSRLKGGFSIDKLVAEFRVLRASVNRIWWECVPIPHKEQIYDMSRFHEAIDQLVATSVAGYSERADLSRRLFLGMLGHDLQQPLYSIRMFTEILIKTATLPSHVVGVPQSMARCCDSMGDLLSDLLDYTTTQHGTAMPVSPAAVNLEVICQEVVSEVRLTVPDRTIIMEAVGDLHGHLDPIRMRQMFSNLMSNALHHGVASKPIAATLRGSDSEMILAVHNMGRPIPRKFSHMVFDPLVRMADSKDHRSGSLGLGLYICREIVAAHGGRIEVKSTAKKGTTFTVTLPKRNGTKSERRDLSTVEDSAS